jgi:hypothetical protein
MSGRHKEIEMGGLALLSFVGVFAFGDQILGWPAHSSEIQLGLFLAFVSGAICGFRLR